MSALGQKRTHAAQQRRSLFDHLVGLLFLRYERNGRRTHSGELHDHLTIFRPDIVRRAFWLRKECAHGIGLIAIVRQLLTAANDILGRVHRSKEASSLGFAFPYWITQTIILICHWIIDTMVEAIIRRWCCHVGGNSFASWR